MKPLRYPPWRRRMEERRLRAEWLAAAERARTPIVYLATDENTPLLASDARANRDVSNA